MSLIDELRNLADHLGKTGNSISANVLREKLDRIEASYEPRRSVTVDPSNTNAHEERMLRWFAYGHLPEKLQPVSAPWCELAVLVCHTIKPGPERTVALRKLLEGKDAAIRAALYPGA